MNLQQANLEDLLRIYFLGTSAWQAAERLCALIRDNQDRQLAILLRHHRERPITDREEIKTRAAVDRLITCCGVMEIASLTGFVGNWREHKEAKDFLVILKNERVRQYYENFYPSKLPLMFRARLEGINDFVEIDSSNSITYVLAFLELDRRFTETLEDRTFLKMLDSFRVGTYKFNDMVALIDDPKTFADHLLFEREKRDSRSRALYEFGLFMEFCFGLEKLLTLTAARALVQSEIWSHYGYWFEVKGNLFRKRLDRALEGFLKWEPPDGAKEDAQLQAQKYVAEARSVLRELTSNKFAAPVETLLAQFKSLRKAGGVQRGA